MISIAIQPLRLLITTSLYNSFFLYSIQANCFEYNHLTKFYFMKTIKKVFLTMLTCALFFNLSINAQEEQDQEQEYEPVILAVTTLHRTSDKDVDNSDWLETEKEYFDKVTIKNDLIIGSGVYFHYFTPDASEIVVVSVYKTWNDVEAATELTSKLVKEAWPEEEARKAYFKKRNSYYSPLHSDEIYSSTKFGKELKTDSKEPLIYYVKKNIGGNGDIETFKEYYDNVIMKNDIIKGYYTHSHMYGSNSREFNEVFVFDSFADIEKAFDEDDRLVKDHWEFEDKRKEFMKKHRDMFENHGDYIYQNVPELDK